MTAPIDVALLRQLVRHDAETRELVWLPRPIELFAHKRDHRAWNARFAGKPAFFSKTDGYRIGRIFGRTYVAHRVIWALLYGFWPEEQIDHINGNRSDNRIENLRAVSNRENAMNAKRRVDNKSGVTGVCWCDSLGRWQAKIGKRRLGKFTTMEAAISARDKAAREHCYHPNHGRTA